VANTPGEPSVGTRSARPNRLLEHPDQKSQPSPIPVLGGDRGRADPVLEALDDSACCLSTWARTGSSGDEAPDARAGQASVAALAAAP
jgi:hypothetical protein